MKIAFKATIRCYLTPRVGPGAWSQCETTSVFESEPEPFDETMAAFEERARKEFQARGWYVPQFRYGRACCPFHQRCEHWNKKPK